MSPAVTVVVPTFREADNLPLLIPRIAQALSEAERTFEIVVVDDDSNDGTDRICEELSRDLPLRLIVRRSERGLSSAVLHGIAASESTYVAVLDADLSHPPEALPELIDRLEDGADFALGSRYVAGGTTAKGWGVFRSLNSRIATLLARPLVELADPMSGFFAIRRSTVENAAPLDPVGFKIALELIVKGRCTKTAEVPIHFSNRLHGESKLGLREQWGDRKSVV